MFSPCLPVQREDCPDEAVSEGMLVSSAQEQVPTEMEESLSLEISKTHLHKALSILF